MLYDFLPLETEDHVPRIEIDQDFGDCVELEKHDATPIKSAEDIRKISDYFVARNEFRNNMLFICGINFGLRVSDLRLLKFGHLIDPNTGDFREKFYIVEQKTENTRSVRVRRPIFINAAVKQAVTIFLDANHRKLSDYMFSSTGLSPLTRQQIGRIIKAAATKVGVGGRISTHTLRKTFGYWGSCWLDKNEKRFTRNGVAVVQSIFGHSDERNTMRYIGMDEDEWKKVYLSINLGLR